MFGSQVIWHILPFGPIKGHFTPIEEFKCKGSVKIEDDSENGTTRVIGHELQTCEMTIRVTKATGSDPLLIINALEQCRGISSPVFITSSAPLSLSNHALDALQTSDWTQLTTLGGAADLAKSLLLGFKLGNTSFMLTEVERKPLIVLSDGTIIDAKVRLLFVEDPPQRFFGGLKIYINEKEIKKIFVTECLYDTHAEGEADTLQLKFEKKNEWEEEKPKAGDMVRITDGVVDSGQMYIDKMKPENGGYVITAMSAPKKAFDKRSRSFENLSLPQIAKKIAEDHKLGIKSYGVSNTKYAYVQQRGQSDLAFLAERCRLAGSSFIVFNKELCIYDEQAIENRDPAKTIILPASVKAEFTDDAQEAYSRAEVTNSKNTGKATDNEVKTDKTLMETIYEKTLSLSDMNRIATALLRNANKKRKTGTVTMATQRQLAAGSVINLIAGGWMGKAFIYRCRHDLKMKKTKIWIRKPLNY